MKPLSTTLLALLPLLTACSGESTPVFDDPVTAMEQAEAALASGEVVKALAGLQYASEHGDKEIKPEALYRLCGAHARHGDEDGALEAFSGLDHASLSMEAYKDILFAAHEARLPDLGEQVSALAAAHHPSMLAELQSLEADFEGFRLNLEPETNMSELGYTGDEATRISTPKDDKE